jgi:hypothetical protein
MEVEQLSMEDCEKLLEHLVLFMDATKMKIQIREIAIHKALCAYHGMQRLATCYYVGELGQQVLYEVGMVCGCKRYILEDAHIDTGGARGH